jgi:TolB-like protein/Flp pilus assembly protein TadD
MKHCPECNKNYADPTISFCLEDGSSLIFGPAVEEPQTAIISGKQSSEAATRTFEPAPVSNPSYSQISANRRSIVLGAVILFVAAIGIGAYFYYRPNPSRQIESIAVMPFVNGSGNPDMEFLSDGMTETLIGRLQQLSGVNVKAPSSVFRYKGKEVSGQTIGRELNVQALLHGRLLQRGDDLVLSLSLVDAATENQLWHRQYNRKLTNLIALQSEIAQDVAENLKAKLSGSEQQQLTKSYTNNPEAFQLYHRGRYHWNKRPNPDYQRSIEYFNQSIAIDPNNAPAYSGLADVYVTLFDSDGSYSRDHIMKARAAAETALKLDDGLAEAHRSFGSVLLLDYDFNGAEREFRRAIDLDPNDALAHRSYSGVLLCTGRFDEAIAESRRAVELEPLSPFLNNSYGNTLVHARRYDEGIAHLIKTMELEPEYWGPCANTALGYLYKGDHAQALEYYAKGREKVGQNELAALMRQTFAAGGWRGYLEYGFKHFREPSPYLLARNYIQLDDKDETFRQLNRAFEVRDPRLKNLKIEPLFDSIRDDPRYHELLKKVGFPG